MSPLRCAFASETKLAVSAACAQWWGAASSESSLSWDGLQLLFRTRSHWTCSHLRFLVFFCLGRQAELGAGPGAKFDQVVYFCLSAGRIFESGRVRDSSRDYVPPARLRRGDVERSCAPPPDSSELLLRRALRCPVADHPLTPLSPRLNVSRLRAYYNRAIPEGLVNEN